MSSVPMSMTARDELREGLGSLRTDGLVGHPVEQIQQTVSNMLKITHIRSLFRESLLTQFFSQSVSSSLNKNVLTRN